MNPRSVRYVLVFLLMALLQACGGSGGDGAASTSPTNATNVSGVAATGLAINGTVTLKDAGGATRSTAIAQPGGEFSIDVAGLTPPYFLKAADNAGTITLYSVASEAGNANINPITNLVLVAAAMNVDPLAKTPDVVFDHPTDFTSLTAAHIQAATSSVMAQMSPAFQAALSANNASNVNPLTGSFKIGTGLDRVFDQYAVTLNAATGEVQERQVAGNNFIVTTLGLVDKLGIFPAAGIYDGTVNPASGGSRLVKDAVVTPSGEMRYVMDNGVQVVAKLSVSGTTVTGTGKAYAPTLNGQPTAFLFADGSKAINLTINGTVGAGGLLGTYTYGNFRDTFSFTLNTRLTGNTSSLSKIAGSYASSADSNTTFIGHIETNGKIWGSGPEIVYSGLVQVVDPNANIYRVTLVYQKNGTYGYVSGLASYDELSPAADTLSMPTVLVPDGYSGEVANLGYSQTVTGSHGKFSMQLSNSLQPILLNAVRLSPQLQTIAARPTADALMIQEINDPALSITTAGNLQYCGSAAAITIPFSAHLAAGSVNIVTNPGSIALNSPTSVVASGKLFTLNGTVSAAVTSSASVGPSTSASIESATPPPGTLTITANPLCKTYDGTNYSGGNGVTYRGFIDGDTPAVLSGTLSYGGSAQGARNAGTYTISPGGLTSSKYSIVYVDGTLSITPALVNATINNAPKTYDGSTSGEAATISSGFIGSVGYGSTAAAANSGNLTTVVPISISGLTLSGANSGNYSVSTNSAAGSTLTTSAVTLSAAQLQIAP